MNSFQELVDFLSKRDDWKRTGSTEAILVLEEPVEGEKGYSGLRVRLYRQSHYQHGLQLYLCAEQKASAPPWSVVYTGTGRSARRMEWSEDILSYSQRTSLRKLWETAIERRADSDASSIIEIMDAAGLYKNNCFSGYGKKDLA